MGKRTISILILSLLPLLAKGQDGGVETKYQGLDIKYVQAYYGFLREPWYRALAIPYNEFVDPAGREHGDFSDADTVRIGFLGLLSGPAKGYAEEMKKGVLMAIDEINAAGGYHGKPLKLYVEDTKGDMGICGNKTVKLIYDHKVLAILGSTGSGKTHVALRIALKAETPEITSISTDPTITQIMVPWIFRCLADDWSQGRALARLVIQELGFKKIATLEQDSRYGRMGIQEFRRVAQRMGYPVRVALKFPGKAKDYTPMLRIVKNYNPEAIVVWALYWQASRITKQAREMGITAPIFGSDGFVSTEYLKLTGPAAEGVVVTFPYDHTRPDPLTQSFNRRFKERYGYPPDSFAAHGYDAMYILWRAIKIGGLNRGRIRDALATTKNFHGVTGEITFDHMNNDTRKVTFAIVKDGDFVPFETVDQLRKIVGEEDEFGLFSRMK